MARVPGDTDKARNLSVAVEDGRSLDEFEPVLMAVADELGLTQSHVTTLSQKKYPGNRHWHFKEALDEKGCLDVTYWPNGRAVWVTIRNYEPQWVHEKGERMAAVLASS